MTGSSADTPSMIQASNNAMLYDSGASGPNTTHHANYKWLSDTKVVLFPGTNKFMLTIQSPLICLIFQDTFEHLCVSLLFIHAFPEPALTCSMISEALGVAIQSHLPRVAVMIHPHFSPLHQIPSSSLYLWLNDHYH